MNINSGDARLVLLCPAWKKWGTARTVKPGTVILHSRADDVVPFADSEELVRNSGLPASALIEVGTDHRLADPEPLAAMLKACIHSTNGTEMKSIIELHDSRVIRIVPCGVLSWSDLARRTSIVQHNDLDSIRSVWTQDFDLDRCRSHVGVWLHGDTM